MRRICFNDFDREIVLVVDRTNVSGSHEILGVGRLSKGGGRNEAEFAVVIGTPWQGQGLGSELLRRLVDIGRDEQLKCITGQMLADNREMIAIARKMGFAVSFDLDGATCKAELVLAGSKSLPTLAPPRVALTES